MLERLFKLSQNHTKVSTELFAGLTTFLTMSYILFVQPTVLSTDFAGKPTGLSMDAVLLATGLAAFLATLIMGLYANYPIAQAPGMGENFFFVSVVMALGAQAVPGPHRVALGVVLIAGVLFLVLSLFRVREAIIDAVSPCLKNGIAVGIGLFIAFIGLKNAGVIVAAPGTFVRLNPGLAENQDIWIFFGILLVTAILQTLHVPGAILLGIVAGTAGSIALDKVEFKWSAGPVAAVQTAQQAGISPLWEWIGLSVGCAVVFALAIACILYALKQQKPVLMGIAGGVILGGAAAVVLGTVRYKGICGLPKDHAFFQCDVKTVWQSIGSLWPYILIFLFMDMFDTVGTLIGVGEQAGLIKDNKLPNANRALLSDAVGTVAGAAMGTSTVTSYIESAAGVAQGGRTGLTSVCTAILFLLALFFSPVIKLVGSYAPITAPALVIVGAMMMKNVAKIDWDDYSEAIPCFLIILGIPLCFSIADGLAMGLIAYPIVRLLTGKIKGTHWLSYVVAAAFLARYVYLTV